MERVQIRSQPRPPKLENFDLKDLHNLATKTAARFEDATSKYKTALQSGDSSAIAGAKIDYDKAERAFTMAMTLGDKFNQIFMRIIDSIRNR